jgi:hypothetical protein
MSRWAEALALHFDDSALGFTRVPTSWAVFRSEISAMPIAALRPGVRRRPVVLLLPA